MVILPRRNSSGGHRCNVYDFYLYFTQYSIPTDEDVQGTANTVQTGLQSGALSQKTARGMLGLDELDSAVNLRVKDILVPRELHEIIQKIDVSDLVGLSNEICARFFRSNLTPDAISKNFQNVIAVVPITSEDVVGFTVKDADMRNTINGQGVGKLVHELSRDGVLQGQVWGVVREDFLQHMRNTHSVELWARMLEMSRPEISYRFELEADAIIVSAMHDDAVRAWQAQRTEWVKQGLAMSNGAGGTKTVTGRKRFGANLAKAKAQLASVAGSTPRKTP